jgi:hypothetical protein
MSGFTRLCKDLAHGSDRAAKQAWREEVFYEGALWRNCHHAVQDPSALDTLKEVHDRLTGDAPVALVASAWRCDDGEARRFLADAGRLVAAAAVALLARHRTSVPGVEGQLLRWAYRAAALRADEPPPSLELPSSFVSDDESSLVRRCFALLAPHRQDSWRVGAASDAALALLGLRPDPLKRQAGEGCLRIPILLARREEGFVAWLWLERMTPGLGEFYQAPATAFLPLAPDLRQALETAHQQAARHQRELRAWDVRWWLADMPREAGEALQATGASLQAAAEVGLTLLGRGFCYDASCVISATVHPDGRLGPVGGVTDAGQPKLHAALGLRPAGGAVTVVLSEANRLPETDVKRWEAGGLRVVHAADVPQACELASGLPSDLLRYFAVLRDLPDRPEELPQYFGGRTRTALYVEPDVLRRERKAAPDLGRHGGVSDRNDDRRSPHAPSAAEVLDIGEEVLYADREGETERRLTWAEAQRELDQPRARSVILAPPGQGKSLLTQMMARELAGRASTMLWQQVPSDRLPLAVVVPLNVLTSREAPAGEPPEESLRASLVHALTAMGCKEVAPYLAAHAHEERSWLFLDALDEVSTHPETEKALNRLFAVLREADWRCRVVITSRPYGYRERSLPFDVSEYRLAQFSAGQQRAFIAKWAGPGDGQARMAAVLARSPAVEQAAQNPFLLTLVCAIAEDEEMPHDIRRTQLYDRALEKMLGGHNRAAEWLPLLADLAWTLFRRDPRDLRITGQALLEFVRDSDDRPPVSGKAGDLSRLEKATVLCEELRKQRLLVRVAASGDYVFAHRSFAEYLTACYLAGRINKHGWDADAR